MRSVSITRTRWVTRDWRAIRRYDRGEYWAKLLTRFVGENSEGVTMARCWTMTRESPTRTAAETGPKTTTEGVYICVICGRYRPTDGGRQERECYVRGPPIKLADEPLTRGRIRVSRGKERGLQCVYNRRKSIMGTMGTGTGRLTDTGAGGASGRGREHAT